jgi:hypothetical protein
MHSALREIEGLLAIRFVLILALALLDAGGESRMGYLNSLQVRDRKLSDAELRLLGGPGAVGIPTNDLPEHSVR